MILVMPLMWHFLPRGLLPKGFPGLSIDRQDHELVFLGRLLSPSKSAATPTPPLSFLALGRTIIPLLLSRQNRSRHCARVLCHILSGRNRRQEKDLLSPNHRCPCSPARQFHLPLHILRPAPLQRRIRLWSFACPQGTPPLCPIFHRSSMHAQRTCKAQHHRLN